ncbi:MAG: cation diffusion facilitator family transporter [bacterium]
MHPTHRPKVFEECAGHSPESHAHSHKTQERKKLLFCMVLTLSMMGVEIAGGFLSGSLALLSDAGHMFTDFFTLAMSFFAILIASRPVNAHKTYGYFRAEVITALFNGILLIGASGFIFYEAYERLSEPVPVHTTEMLLIALLGLIINLLSGYLLFDVRGKDINLKGAFAHVLSDTLSSVGVVIGALVIRFTAWTRIDPLLSFLIGSLVLFWAGKLVRDSIHILMESTPKHINLTELVEILKKEVKGVKEIHDVHVWEITTHMYAMTAHVTTDCKLLSECMGMTERINQVVSERFHIEHVNLQYEC